jgi:hypothetical protein
MSDIGGFNNQQVDAILDLIDECRLARQAWDSCGENTKSHLVLAAIESVKDAGMRCRFREVEYSVVIDLICRNLPTKVQDILAEQGAIA